MSPYDSFSELVRNVNQKIYRFDSVTDFATREMEWSRRIQQLTESPMLRYAEDLRLQENLARGVQPSFADRNFTQMADSQRDFDPLIESPEAILKLTQQLAPPQFDFTFPDTSPPAVMVEDSTRWLDNLQFPIERIKAPLPDFAFPEGCTLAHLQQMSDDEIRAFVDGNPSLIAVQLVLHELAMRRIDRAARPHWSVIWTFWLVLASVLIGAIGVLLALR
jgi:hypothetical protein